MQNHWHAAVNRRRHGIRDSRQNRAGLYPISACVFPAIPQPGEREQLAFTDCKAIRLLGHSFSTRKKHLLESGTCGASGGSRNAGLFASVSDFAFIVLIAMEGLLLPILE
jgi:hypothetical protein